VISSGYLRAIIEDLIMPHILKMTRKKRAAKDMHRSVIPSEAGNLSAGFAAPQKEM
jgi:hypothetical protein